MMTTSQRGRWTLPTPKGPWKVAHEFLSKPGVWLRLAVFFGFTCFLYVLMFAWSPAFPYRARIAPLRNLHARTAFEAVDQAATARAIDQVREKYPNYYVKNSRPLDQIQQGLIDDLFEVKQKSYAESGNFWKRFLPINPVTSDIDESANNQKEFDRFKSALLKDEKLTTTRKAVENALVDVRKNGLLRNLEHELEDGNMQEIQVYESNIDDAVTIDVSQVRMAEIFDQLKLALLEEFSKNAETISEPAVVANKIFNWLKPRLPVTITWDEENSRRGRRKAASQVADKKKQYLPGDPLEKLNNRGIDEPVIRAMEPLDDDDIALLYQEHLAFVDSQTTQQMLLRTGSFFGLFGVIATLVCGYLYYRDYQLLLDFRHFLTLVGLFTLTLAAAWVLSLDSHWRAEITPVIIFSLIVAIAYQIELSVFLSAMVALSFSVLHGYGLGEFVTLMTAASTAALMCGSIRSRAKLVYVGIAVASTVFPSVLGVQYLLGQPLAEGLLLDAIWFSANAALAGLIMTAALPFLESWFGLQTDINLLELSDANHPLLKELVQRAPGTYNHSINVASISESAADAIGANGLLCRVGAYFHDIGKLRKPDYFIENQAGGENKHDDLNPAMSTLVIIAHVKEGAEMARQHHLPERIIDLIEQHHGTTLVSYFFDRATKQSENNEDSMDVQEIDYRYPGPKPQSREAAVMMLADAVESASRALREPTPSRIENLVSDIAKHKLDDGQFDECEITLQQLHTIQENLIKSLNAMYHARVKYPDQQSA
ncbi:MAG: HDIG domain-containing metalloprotein [Planctomycetota bacterium]